VDSKLAQQFSLAGVGEILNGCVCFSSYRDFNHSDSSFEWDT
jgi:hypothetical protein